MFFGECLSSSRYNHYCFKDTSELPKWRREKIALSWSDTCLTPITARVHITSAFTDGLPFPYIWVWEIDLKTCTSWKISIPLSAPNLWAEILKYLQQLPICKNASNLCINLHFSKAEPEVIGEEASAQLMHHPQAAFRKSFFYADSPIAVIIYPFLGLPLSSLFACWLSSISKTPKPWVFQKKCFASRLFCCLPKSWATWESPKIPWTFGKQKKNTKNQLPPLAPAHHLRGSKGQRSNSSRRLESGQKKVQRKKIFGKHWKTMSSVISMGFMDGYPLAN